MLGHSRPAPRANPRQRLRRHFLRTWRPEPPRSCAGADPHTDSRSLLPARPPTSASAADHPANGCDAPTLPRTLALGIIYCIMLRRSFLATPLATFQLAAEKSNDRVYASSDGIPHTPAEYARLLAGLTADGKLTPDSYSRGGVVAEL